MMRVTILAGALFVAAGHSMRGPAKTALVAKACAGKEEPDCDEHSKDNVLPPCMANSEIIPGVDCGHVSEVIPKFQKSHLVGNLQGEATNAISDADAAAAAAKAEEAADKATEASGSLETKLDDMKTTNLKKTGPYAMPEKKIQKLKAAK